MFIFVNLKTNNAMKIVTNIILSSDYSNLKKYIQNNNYKVLYKEATVFEMNHRKGQTL